MRCNAAAPAVLHVRVNDVDDDASTLALGQSATDTPVGLVASGTGSDRIEGFNSREGDRR